MRRFCAFIAVAAIAVFAWFGWRENYNPLKTSGSVPEAPYTQEILPSDKVRMELVEGGVTPTSVKVVLINEDECVYTYGEEFYLHKLIDGQWYTMSWINDNVGFMAVGYLLEPGRVEKTYSWKFVHGEMDPGKYRIVTDVFPDGADPDVSSILLSVPFTVE